MSERVGIEGAPAASAAAPGGAPRQHPERPPWLRVRYRQTPELEQVQALVRDLELNTVCHSAACPNLPECWGRRTATFMLGGNVCTRRCGFCDVRTGRPDPLDPDEPRRVADAIRSLELRFAVITAVARDDVADGGAAHFAAVLGAVRQRAPGCRVEVLIPDFKGREEALRTVLDADPDVLNHNLETVERLQRRVRPAARYDRSLELLERAHRLRPDVPTKSGIMLGLGETAEEVRRTLADVRAQVCTLITIGHYLRPGPGHLPIERYATPEEFAMWEAEARALGFTDVASGPFVRSSYRAERLAGLPG
jgi:lipoic acid synthetase